MKPFSKLTSRYLLTTLSIIFSISVLGNVSASGSTASLGAVVENNLIFPIVQNTELGRI